MTLVRGSNIILIGFMACGKTRVGEMLSQRLGFGLLDLDAEIATEQGQSIDQIFAQYGEAHFRSLEEKKLQQLKNLSNTVVVTGGGTPMSFTNQQELKRLGHIFYLDANFSLIRNRLQTSQKRPLGKVNSLEDEARLKDLFIFRRPVYLNLGHVIDVNHQDKTRTCDEIKSMFDASRQICGGITINKTVGHYDIFIEPGLVDRAAVHLNSLGLDSHRPAIITSDHLQGILAEKLASLRQALGIDTVVIGIKDGEIHKNQSNLDYIHEQLFCHGFGRQSVLLSVGGGTVGDVAGFAAATFMRGIPIIHLPTSLLSMVDSSIGGKTGIDNAFGKNLIGAFYDPKVVLIDPEFLQTLPAGEFSAGMAEVIKHGIIGDRALFFELLNGKIAREEIIRRAIQVKADVVFLDPGEKNVRMHLNLGHTFAHALEKVSNYALSHGQAVAIGLVMATKLAKRLGMLEEDFLPDLLALLTHYDLPTTCPANLDKNQILHAMQHDKKRDPSGLKFIVPHKVGTISVTYAEEKEVLACL